MPKKNKIVLLLSDNDPVMVRVYKNKVEKQLGWETIQTNTPEELVKAVEKELPDLIVTDLILKNGSAHDALEELKNHKQKNIAEIPIVILTDLRQKEDIDYALELGAHEYLIKTEKTLNEVIEQLQKIHRALPK